MADSDIKTYSKADLEAMRARGESMTRADGPEYEPDEAFWHDARVIHPGRTEDVRIRQELVAWFKQQGGDYEGRINEALSDWVEERQHGRR